ncbi:MAG: iron-sulfur cluster assembly scaffold protein [Dehalococcoidia bacterium]|nr:iron-sulfur cluster assembly scaffold protein [Dehalococcoidia bacterium]
MQICLRVSQGRILEAKFMNDGCGPVIACGSVTTEMVKGRTISEAMALSEDDIMTRLDGLPDGERHCAMLAVSALKQVPVDYMALRREPWTRLYRQVKPFEPNREPREGPAAWSEALSLGARRPIGQTTPLS